MIVNYLKNLPTFLKKQYTIVNVKPNESFLNDVTNINDPAEIAIKKIENH